MAKLIKESEEHGVKSKLYSSTPCKEGRPRYRSVSVQPNGKISEKWYKTDALGNTYCYKTKTT